MTHKKQSVFKKIIMGMGIAAFAVAGYLTFSVTTSCPAEAYICICQASCTFGAGAQVGSLMGTVFTPDLLIANFNILLKLVTVADLGVMPALLSSVQMAQADMMSWWDTFWQQNLKPTMQFFAQQLSVAQMEQATALGKFQDAMNANRLLLSMQIEEFHNHRELRPGENICVIATQASSFGKVNEVKDAYARAAVLETSPRSYRTAGSGPAARGTAAAVAADWQNYVNRYCDPTENAGNAGCDTEGTFAGEDLNITGNIFTRDTIDVESDPEMRTIIDDMLKNLAEPLVGESVPESALASTQGREALFNTLAYTAKRRAIYEALYFPYARRVPGGAGDEATEFLSEIRLEAGIDPALLSPNPSYQEIMHVMMSERYRTGKTGVNQIEEPENNARELVTQQGFQAMQMKDTLDLLDRYALVLAARVGERVRDSKILSSKGALVPK